MINSETLTNVYEHLEYQSLGELWAITLYPKEYNFPEDYSSSYTERINLFCLVIEWLLENRKMRLANKGVFLKGNTNDQVDQFRKSFPKTEEEMNEKDAYWWYLDECPAGAVWYTDVDDDGFQTTPVGDGRFYYWT